MKVRTISPSEYGKLPVSTSALLEHILPQDVTVIVVEEDGKVVACSTIQRLTHINGVWIVPEKRGGAGVARALLDATMAEAESRSGWVLAATENHVIRRVLKWLGAVELPQNPGMSGFVLELVKKTRRKAA